MSNLPVETTKPKVPEVPMEIQERVISESHALESFKRSMGVVEVSHDTLSDLEAIGIYTKGRGILNIQRGNAMVNQQLLRSIFAELATAITKGKLNKKTKKREPLTVAELSSLARTAGYLSSKVTESQKFSVEMERVRATTDSMTEDDTPATRVFKPGTKVPAGQPATNIITENVHIHQGAQAKLPEPPKV
jgi:hypothetical protein